jgi:hypothetical protein
VAYVAFVVLGLLYFPAKVSFRFAPPCQLAFDMPLAAGLGPAGRQRSL